jgi:toxin ParE1/3/4
VTRVRWTTDAADDLARIVERIREDNPAAAQRVANTIYSGVAALRTFPNRGRIGLVRDTRELVFAPWPYIAVYEIVEDQVLVLRIRHTSQDWP